MRYYFFIIFVLLYIRPLRKLASEEQVLASYGAENRSVHEVREDLSTGVTTQLPSEVEFPKRSISSKISASTLLMQCNYDLLSQSSVVNLTNHDMINCSFEANHKDEMIQDIKEEVIIAQEEYVILIHGMAQSKNSMKQVAEYLKSQGYIPIVIDYPSRKYPIERLAQEFIAKQILELDINCKKIHIIGYSLGGILARYVIDNFSINNLGYVLLVGSPNRGSEMAHVLGKNIFIKKIFGPAVKDLSPAADFWDKIRFDVSKYHVGVIDGDFSMNPISSLFVFNGKNDGTVSVESTKLDGMKDFKTLHYSHYFLMRNKEILPYISNFLKTGAFSQVSK